MKGHLSIGQEAAIAGARMALRDDDYITGTHRSHGHPIGKGALPLVESEPAAGQWEPYDGRLSRTVLQGAGGETPPVC